MQRPFLAVNHLLGVEFSLTDGSSRGLGWHTTEDTLRARRLVLLATRLLVALFVPAVQRSRLCFVRLSDGSHQQFIQPDGYMLAATTASYQFQDTIKAALATRLHARLVPAAGHQGHAKSTAHKQCHHVVLALQTMAKQLQQRTMWKQLLYFTSYTLKHGRGVMLVSIRQSTQSLLLNILYQSRVLTTCHRLDGTAHFLGRLQLVVVLRFALVLQLLGSVHDVVNLLLAALRHHVLHPL